MSAIFVVIVVSVITSVVTGLARPFIGRWRNKRHNNALLRRAAPPFDRVRYKGIFVHQNNKASTIARRVFSASEISNDLVRQVYLNIVWDDEHLRDASVDLIERSHVLMQELFGVDVSPSACFDLVQMIPADASTGLVDEFFDYFRYAVECARSAYTEPSVEICFNVFEQIHTEALQ
ncbi:MAG: hypothetical protein AAB426_11290 [Myxococcota bacterium]